MKRNSILFAFFTLLTLLTVTGCKENPIAPDLPIEQAKKGLYILNEGLFSQNNSTITFYDLTTQQVTQNVFEAANARKLGDTGNDIVISGRTAFVAVNVSNKLEIFNTNNFKSKGTVDLGENSSPRRIWAKDSVTVYVSGYSGKVYKVNANTLSIEKEIPVGSFPEGIIEHGGKLFVANCGLGGGNTVSVIDLATDAVVKTITVGTNPINLVKDRNNFVYTVCKGRYDSSDIGGALYRIDPVTMQVQDSIIVTQNPEDAIVTADNVMYLLNNLGLIKVDLNQRAPVAELVVDGMSINTIYGYPLSLVFDPVSKLLYIGNPKDFVQNGEMVVYDLDGREIRRFNTGLNPGSVAIVNY